MSKTVPELLDIAIERAGSQQKLGEEIGVSQNAIYAARKAGRVSAELAFAIDQWSRGFISKHDLRPDIFPLQKARTRARRAA